MSDDAALWKLAFGVLILALCGLTVALRKPPAAHATAAVIAQPAPAAVVAVPPPARIEAPEAPPPRIEVVLEDPHDAPAAVPAFSARPADAHRAARIRSRGRAHCTVAVASRAHGSSRRVPRPLIHRVVSAGPQYPFDPRERWNPRF